MGRRGELGVMCEHYDCRCARAAELAVMGQTAEAVRVHGEQVRCRRAGPDKATIEERIPERVLVEALRRSR